MVNLYYVSLGCDKNLVDSEIMLGIINRAGYKIINDENQADIIVINTCGFIMDATDEGIETILSLAKLKKEGVCKGIIVTGCMAQRYKEEIFKELPEVDAVVGTGDFEEIANVIESVIGGKKNVSIILDKNKKLDESVFVNRVLTTPSHYAYLKISEGCDNFCTYCTIPQLRGKYRSRSIESLVQETKMLAEQGVREIILVAQDTTLYGIDLYETPKLPLLLEEISNIDGIEWIRILYAYPEHITEEIINAMARNSKVCKYLDMPIQHSNDFVLKRMGRKSTEGHLKNLIRELRDSMPDICLRTTLITGFPGETKEEFESLVGFIKEIEFDKLGVFTYSREEGTPAYNYSNQIDENEKLRRKEYIMEVQKNISAQKLAKKVGTSLQIIVEGKLDEEEVFYGRSYMDAPDVDGFVYFPNPSEDVFVYFPNPSEDVFVNVYITKASDYDLYGEIEKENIL